MAVTWTRCSPRTARSTARRRRAALASSPPSQLIIRRWNLWRVLRIHLDRLTFLRQMSRAMPLSHSAAPSLVVLPTYNECDNVEPIVRAIVAQAPDVDVLVVDDNSPDGTGAIADRLAL